MQRKVLDRAYKDAERELTLSSFALLQDHSHSRITGEPLRKAYERRDEGLNINDSDSDVLRTYSRSATINIFKSNNEKYSSWYI